MLDVSHKGEVLIHWGPMNARIRFALYTTVFLTGAAVLIIEVTAVRILSPHFGSSLFVFSSVLTVILAALSVGYYIGGRLADRQPHHEPLFAIISLSGVAVLISELIAVRVLPFSTNILSVFSGPLIFSVLLFFIPAFLLGIVSPFIVKLLTVRTSSEEVGGVVGATFFWGTMGSITGSLLTGFVLVPFFGVTLSVVGTALVLIALGMLGRHVLERIARDTNGSSPTKGLWHNFSLLILFVTIVLLAFIVRTDVPYPYAVVYRADGLYSNVLVYETETGDRTMRVLMLDTNHSSAVFLDSYDLPFPYTQFAEFYRGLKPDSTKFLMIGGGTYGIPRTLVARDPRIHVTVSELEPSLPLLAERYFDLTDTSRIDTHIEDARVFLTKSMTTYDVIFEDAFSTDLGIPAHLVTKEFFTEVKRNLAPDGVFMLNYIGTLTGDAPTFTGSLMRTLGEVFPNFKMFALAKPDTEARQNIVFVARNGDAPIDLSGAFVRFMNGQAALVKNLEVFPEELDLSDEYTLTDDHAPTEYLMLAQQ